MNFLIRKAIRFSSKTVKDVPDSGNPMVLDGVDFMLQIGKGLIKVGKEIL